MNKTKPGKLPRLTTYKDQGTELGAARRFYRAVDSARLRKVVHGHYAANFESLPPADRHRLRALGLAQRGLKDLTLVGLSAASWWGVWLRKTPELVEVIRSKTGQSNGKFFRRSACPLPNPEIWDLGNGIKVLAPMDTVVCLTLVLDEYWAVVAMDWLLGYLVFGEKLSEIKARAQVEMVIQTLSAKTKRTRASMILARATSLSMSPGETLSRLQIIDAGLEVPKLQVTFRDEQGFVAQTDFYFEDSGIAGEFDGKVKYKDPMYLQGRDPGDVLFAEKVREDRLRRQVKTVVRWTWQDLQQPGRLARLLREAGVKDAKQTAATQK